MELWRLKDNLNFKNFKGLWLFYFDNSEFFKSAKLALFQRI